MCCSRITAIREVVIIGVLSDSKSFMRAVIFFEHPRCHRYNNILPIIRMYNIMYAHYTRPKRSHHAR